MNKKRRVSFLVKLKGLYQQVPPTEIIPVGFPLDDWTHLQIQKNLASGCFWLDGDRLTDFDPQDFPDINHNDLASVPSIIKQFDHYALKDGTITKSEKKQALELLLSLCRIFEPQLENVHGTPIASV